MSNISSLTTKIYDDVSGSNPSLITAGLPSSSIMTTRLHLPPSTLKQNQYFNQNQATDTQPMSLNSQQNDSSQYTTLSHRTISDTYLNLSRKDINDVMTALHTLARYVQDDILNTNPQHGLSIDENEDHHLTILDSNSTNHSLKSSSHYYSYDPQYSKRHRRHSLSSDRWLNHRHIKHHVNLVEKFQHDLSHIKHKQERQLQRHHHHHHHHRSSYPSYSSNAILYTLPSGSNIRPRQIYHCSQQHPSTIKIPPSSHLFDKLIYIDQKELISNIQILPQQAHTLQILQNHHMHSLMSFDSLNTKERITTPLLSSHIPKSNHDQTYAKNKSDMATQWSLQMLTPSDNEIDISKSDLSIQNQNQLPDHSELPLTRAPSTILTELSQSISTISTINKTLPISQTHLFGNNSSSINNPSHIDTTCLEKTSLVMNDKDELLTKSITERILTTFNIPICKCSIGKSHALNTNAKYSLMDENNTCITIDNDLSIHPSSSTPKRKKTKQIPTKCTSKRSRRPASKSSRNNQVIKRTCLHCHSPSKLQVYEALDLKEDSSFDFFDMDMTFSETYDRVFPDITASEKSL